MNHRSDGLKWLWIGLAGMFILIGVAILIDAVTGKLSAGQVGVTGNGWISDLVWGIVAIWVLTLIFWPWEKRHSSYGGWRDRDDEAMSILRKRYASGDLTKDQFDQMMTDLRKNGRG